MSYSIFFIIFIRSADWLSFIVVLQKLLFSCYFLIFPLLCFATIFILYFIRTIIEFTIYDGLNMQMHILF